MESPLYNYLKDQIEAFRVRGVNAQFEADLASLPQRFGSEALSVFVPGCGVDHADNYNLFERGYATPQGEKWASRAAAGGWRVTGVDQFAMNIPPKEWEFLQRDLTDQSSWSDLPGSPFDLVFCMNLIDLNTENGISPSLVIGEYQGRKHYPFDSTRFGDTAEGPLEQMSPFDQMYARFVEVFLRNITSVLKPSGLAFINSQILRREGDGLVSVYAGRSRGLLGVISY